METESPKLTSDLAAEIDQLKKEKLDLIATIQAFQADNPKPDTSDVPNLTAPDEFKGKYEQCQLLADGLKEQLIQSNKSLNEMTSLYETTKQHELEEKNKTKHLERSVRALKIEKDQLFTVGIVENLFWSTLFTTFGFLITCLGCEVLYCFNQK